VVLEHVVGCLGRHFVGIDAVKTLKDLSKIKILYSLYDVTEYVVC
jgi:hypothetical protein